MKMKKTGFETLYKDVPAKQSEQLRLFRLQHKTQRIDVQGKKWTYVSCGEGKKTLLFLPGAFLKADMWFYAVSVLEKAFRIIAPDANTLCGISAAQALAALPRILDREKAKKAAVIGLSAGGGLAQMFQARCPDRVDGLVLSHTGILKQSPAAEKKIGKLIRLVKIIPLCVIRKILFSRTSGSVPRASEWKTFHDAYFRESLSGITRRVIANFLQNSMLLRKDFTVERNVPESRKVRVLILNSKDDHVTFLQIDNLKQQYPNSTVHVFEQGGHHTFMLFPEAYTSVLSAFLKKS
jgi:pimeloyl-ACP methyl ester carboxylesterase